MLFYLASIYKQVYIVYVCVCVYIYIFVDLLHISITFILHYIFKTKCIPLYIVKRKMSMKV